jgi:hypothetical protein
MKLLQKTEFFCVILILSLMGCAAAGNSTIFTIEESTETALISRAVSLIPVPVHREYHEASIFAKTEEHLSVFAVYRNGNTQKLSLDEIEIMLEQTLLSSDTPHVFKSPGEKEVALSYGTLSAQYTIIVRSSTEHPGSPSSPSPGDTTIAIDIQWK